MTKVKICGFTNAENARQAALAGADAIGLVFYDKSPRYVSINVAREIVAALPPFVNRVGLFVNANPSLIDEVLCEVALTHYSSMETRLSVIVCNTICLSLSRLGFLQRLISKRLPTTSQRPVHYYWTLTVPILMAEQESLSIGP